MKKGHFFNLFIPRITDSEQKYDCQGSTVSQGKIIKKHK